MCVLNCVLVYIYVLIIAKEYINSLQNWILSLSVCMISDLGWNKLKQIGNDPHVVVGALKISLDRLKKNKQKKQRSLVECCSVGSCE